MSFSAIGRRAVRLFHTLRYLRLRQLVYQVYYRFFFRTSKVAKSVKTAERGHLIPLTIGLEAANGQLAPTRQFFPPARFVFLNLAYDHPAVNAIDWNYSGHGKLWTYNQNYFEFLRHPDLPTTAGENLILYWIRSCESHRDGWEPYPTSLRIVHWLQFFRERKREIRPLFDLSLRRQYQDLRRKLEYHLDGNHLLENAIALCIAALYFREENEFDRSAKLLLAQLDEQYTQDGGHYERSPMYHCILLWRLLDLYSWKSAAGQHQLCYFEVLKTSLQKQLGWLNAMLGNNGLYPHFNDSTDGIAPLPEDLLNYAGKLGISATKNPLSDSGYRHWRSGDADLWIDAGPIGPDHIPGHGHADNLSFVLALNGQKIIVDTSISTYDKNPLRHRERSTEAHNTVTVDGKNSSDVWAGFRVGKRAYTIIEAEGDYELTAGHDGFGEITHRRRFLLSAGRLLTKDQIGNSVGTARWHLAPGPEVRVSGHSVTVDAILFTFTGEVLDISVRSYDYAMGYNQRKPAECIVVKFQKTLSCEIRWLDERMI